MPANPQRATAPAHPLAPRPVPGDSIARKSELQSPPDYGIMCGGLRKALWAKRKENTMNEIEKLKAEARAVIAACKGGDDFGAAVARLAAIGYALEDALKRV